MITSRSRHRFDAREWGYAPPVTNEPLRRQFVAYFHLVGWDCFSLGMHISVLCPNLELHVPFGFFRIGWQFR